MRIGTVVLLTLLSCGSGAPREPRDAGEEDEGGGGVTCPGGSACGCSRFRKAACGGACCRWVTGNGCRCR